MSPAQKKFSPSLGGRKLPLTFSFIGQALGIAETPINNRGKGLLISRYLIFQFFKPVQDDADFVFDILKTSQECIFITALPS
jgi:hypothetical protein